MSQIILDSANDLIQGDFDNATLSQRTRLQTSTVNATTGVYVIPNGTATSASVQISNNSNVTNASKVVVATNGSTDTQIISGANGSGTYLPLSFYTNNDIRFQMGNAGELNVRTAPGTVSSGTSGQFLTSGGPGAGVSWTTVTVPPSGQVQTQLFTSPGTWTRPSTVTQVRVTVIGGGGGGNVPTGGYGGAAIAIVPVSNPVAITVGSGGNGGTGGGAPGGTSSFGPAVSATGGGGAPNANPNNGVPGSSTVSVGTAIKSGVDVGFGATVRYISSFGAIGGLTLTSSGTSAIAYSASTTTIAGAGGLGVAPGSGNGGTGGAVLVEWVG